MPQSGSLRPKGALVAHYSLLGLSTSASAADVRKQYRKLATKYHPDNGAASCSSSTTSDSASMFCAVAHAYQVILCDKDNLQTPKFGSAELKAARKAYESFVSSELLERDAKTARLTLAAKERGIGVTAIDVCFLMDATESMQPYIDAAKNSVRSVVKEFTTRYGESAKLYFAILAFRDIEDENPRERLDFTDDINQIYDFISDVEATTKHQEHLLANPSDKSKETKTKRTRTGPDFPEDLTGALRDAVGLSWTRPSRAAIVIADAPCHGRDYYDLSEWQFTKNSPEMRDGHAYGGGEGYGKGTVKPEDVDNHPDGDPRGLDPVKLVCALRAKKVDLFFFRINDNTDVMVAKMAKAYDRGHGFQQQWKLTTIEAPDGVGTDPDHLIKLVMRSITTSLSQSSVRSLMGNGGNLLSRSFKAVNTKPRFRPSLASIAANDESLDADNLATQREPVWGSWQEVDVFTAHSGGNSVGKDRVRIQTTHFATGGMRAAFWLEASGEGPLGGGKLVVKEAKEKGARHNSRESLLGDLDSLLTASQLAVRWNRDIAGSLGGLSSSPRVEFLQGYVLHLKATAGGDRAPYLAVERSLPGMGADFRKFNNNAGFVDVANDAEVANAFSHWTWSVTGAEVMVLDMQGVIDGGRLVCTDAQVQSSDLSRFGLGNRGDKGMAEFFAAHRCNGMCTCLGLKRPGEMASGSASPRPVGGMGDMMKTRLNLPSAPGLNTVVSGSNAGQPGLGGGRGAGGAKPLVKPVWVPDTDVFRCQVLSDSKCQAKGGVAFGFFTRRHHCRACGNVVCAKCSKGRMMLPWEELGTTHRVCGKCSQLFTGASDKLPTYIANVQQAQRDAAETSPPPYEQALGKRC